MSLLTLYTSLDWSFMSIHFFVLNLGGWFDVLYNKFIIFDIPLLYYTNLNSSIVCCLFSGDICLSFGVSISFSTVFECNSFRDFEISVILSAILLLIKSPVASAVFWIDLFETVFIAFVVDFLALSKSFWLYFCSYF